mgnify:CR=1 FL=1
MEAHLPRTRTGRRVGREYRPRVTNAWSRDDGPRQHHGGGQSNRDRRPHFWLLRGTTGCPDSAAVANRQRPAGTVRWDASRVRPRKTIRGDPLRAGVRGRPSGDSADGRRKRRRRGGSTGTFRSAPGLRTCGVGSLRLRLPIEPLIAVYAAAGLDALLVLIRARPSQPCARDENTRGPFATEAS